LPHRVVLVASHGGVKILADFLRVLIAYGEVLIVVYLGFQILD